MRWPPGLDPDHLPGREVEVLLWSWDGMVVHAYRGHYEQFPWSATSRPTNAWGIALAKRGAYGRLASGMEQVVDVNTGFFRRPGEEVAVRTFMEGYDELTMIEIDPAALDVVPALAEASGPLRVAPSVDLAHRLLLRAIEDGEDDLAVQSGLVELLHVGVTDGGLAGRGYSRRSTEVGRRRLVRETCELSTPWTTAWAWSSWRAPSGRRRSTCPACSARSRR